MSFFTKNNQEENLKIWDCAKRISVNEAYDPDLPCGWYFFKSSGGWVGLKPVSEGGEMYISDEILDVKDLEEWLGVPVTPPETPKKKTGLDAVIGRAQGQSETKKQPTWGTSSREYEKPYTPPSELENQWAEAKLIEELRKLESEIQESEKEIRDAETILTADKKTISDENQPRKKRKNLGRTNQLSTRVTDIELAEFHQRVEKSGLSQGEFIRNAILNEQIVIEERSAIDVAALDELALLRAELGRQGGLLKMITKPNIGMRTFRPDEWEELIIQSHHLNCALHPRYS